MKLLHIFTCKPTPLMGLTFNFGFNKNAIYELLFQLVGGRGFATEFSFFFFKVLFAVRRCFF